MYIVLFDQENTDPFLADHRNLGIGKAYWYLDDAKTAIETHKRLYPDCYNFRIFELPNLPIWIDSLSE